MKPMTEEEEAALEKLRQSTEGAKQTVKLIEELGNKVEVAGKEIRENVNKLKKITEDLAKAARLLK